MTLTPLGAVSNSGAKEFTNPLSKIALINYNRNFYNYQEWTYENTFPYYKYPVNNSFLHQENIPPCYLKLKNKKCKDKKSKKKSCKCGCGGK